MAIQHLVAHRITRLSPSDPCTVKTAQHAWELNGLTQELFRDMKYNVLRRAGKEYGRFSDDRAEHPAASWLEELTAEKISFSTFTKSLAGQFKTEVDKTEEPFDGYLVLGLETLEADEQLHIFLVQHATGLYIDSELAIAQSHHLDIEGIRLAAKINITDWQSDEDYRRGNAITLLRWRGEKALSDAFSAAVGFSQKIDLAAETEAFLEVVSDYTEGLPEDVASHTRKEVVGYCLEQDSAGKPVVVEELATHIQNSLPTTDTPYTPPPKLTEFIANKQPTSKPELIPDKAQMRNYIRISGRNELLSMSFASSCLGDSVIYDPDNDSLTIKNLPTGLKSKLVKHAGAPE